MVPPPHHASFPRLAAALDAAARPVAFWWRDDDAGTASPALDRLLDVARDAAAPLTLAVIPARAEASLADALAAADTAGPPVAVAQHGYDHSNTAAEGRNVELSDDAHAAWLDGRMAEGWAHLSALFGPRLLPVMVPPWNRADRGALARLPALGFRAVSGLATAPVETELPRIDVDIDVMDWDSHTSRGLAAIDAQAEAGVERYLADAAGSPVGLMTHHLVHDADVWAHVAAFVGLVSAHPKARWVSLGEPLAAARPAPERVSA